MNVFARLTVAEDDGIRRFHYPLIVDLPFKKSESLEVAVRDDDGNLLPCEAYRSRGQISLHIAVSLEPYEKRRLTVFKSENKTAIPDPIKSQKLDDGRITISQERIVTTLLPNSNIGSVIYDGVEHLAGPVTFTLNAEPSDGEDLAHKSSGRELSFQSAATRVYPVNERESYTETSLTACKSWADIVHTIDNPLPGSIISLDIPLTPPTDNEIPTCDFGLGNGIYSKIDGDAVMLEADFYGKKPYSCWQISRLTEGIQRIDYQGFSVTVKELSRSLYFHWTLPTRSIAVAITQLPYTTSHIQALLGRNGRIHISVVLGDVPTKRATLGAVLHFLNDIPAVAAATNPASILAPPRISIKK